VTQRDIEVLHQRLEEAHRTMAHAKDQLDRIEELASATNGRVRELELWRARWQGAATATRFAWLLAGGAITAILIDVIRNMAGG
jgi:chromosome condensin MukBEF ATPase and DNA-binding subunit MukB